MNLLRIFIFLLRFWLIFNKKFKKDTKATSSAISEVTFELFTRRGISFDVALIGNSSNLYIIDELKAKVPKKLAVNHNLNFGLALHRSTLFIVKKVQFLYTTLEYISALFTDTPYHVTYVQNPKDFNPETITPYKFRPNFTIGFFSFYMYFLLDYGLVIKLATLEWWTRAKCDETQLVMLNSFDKTSRKWQNPLKFPKKFINFHGCSLTAVSEVFKLPVFDMNKNFIAPSFPHIYKRQKAKELELMKIFAQAGNFRLKLLSALKLDTHIWILNQIQTYEAPCPITFYNFHLKTMFSAQDPYSNYEKMLLPFDFQTWLFLILVFVSAFVGIFIINHLPQVARDLVFGRGVNMPSFNVIGAFFGVGQTKLPDNNFGRIILMFFILFCLVMRTAYQGVFFEMFTSDMRRRPPETYADLKVQNYTVQIMELELKTKLTNKMAIVHGVGEDDSPQILNVGFQNALKTFERMRNKELNLKAAVPMTDADMKVLKHIYPDLPGLLKQKISVPPTRVCVSRHNFFGILTSKVLQRIIEGGIPQYWYSYLLDFEFRSAPEDPPEPQVFSMEDLNFGFVVWLIACGITSSVFVSEILIFYGKIWGEKFLKLCIGLILFLRLLMNVVRDGIY